MIRSLTSLRFIFAFMVFMSHNIFDSVDYPWVEHLFYEGYAGVSFFFILSGFILMYSNQKRLEKGQITVINFYKARFARIYPLHALTFFIAFIFLQRPILEIGYCLTFLCNLFLLQSFIPIKSFFFSFNAPSWSISNEMFFYLMFPFIVSFFLKKQRFFTLILFLSLVFVFILSFVIVDENRQHFLFYINPFFRIIDFCIGICLYRFCIWVQGKEKYILNKWGNLLELSCVIVFIAFYAFSFYIPQVYRYSFWYWFPMCFVISTFFLSSKGMLSKLLSKKYFVILGEISFGFYLFHQLIKRIFIAFLSQIEIDIPWTLRFCFIFLLTLIVSYMSFKYYETPCNKRIKQLDVNFLRKTKKK